MAAAVPFIALTCNIRAQAQRCKLNDVWRDDVLSPAALESMCGQYDDFDELMTALRTEPALQSGRESEE